MNIIPKKTWKRPKRKNKRQGRRTTLGVDISATRINMALVKQAGDAITLIGAMHTPVPADAINDGTIVDSAALQKAIMDLKSSQRIRASHTVLSLSVKPIIMQTIELPKNTPVNIGQYVNREINQWVGMAGAQILSDYTGLSAVNGPGRLLALATDANKVEALANVFRRARIAVDTLEPVSMGVARALYACSTADRVGGIQLFASLRDDELAICVFRRQAVDYVRMRDISALSQDANDLARNLEQEICSVLHFYDIELLDAPNHWEIRVVVDGGLQVPDQLQSQLAAATGVATCKVVTTENIGDALALETAEKVSIRDTSIAAIGHALRPIVEESGIPAFDVLPPGAARAKTAKLHAMHAAVTAAVIFVLMGLAVMALMIKTEETRGVIAQKRSQTGLSTTTAMVDTKKQLEARIERLGWVPKQLTKILNSRREINWSGFLDDIRDLRPSDLCVTALDTGSGGAITIEGLAGDIHAVTDFMQSLNESEHVAAAHIQMTEQSQVAEHVLNYRILCSTEPPSEI